METIDFACVSLFPHWGISEMTWLNSTRKGHAFEFEAEEKAKKTFCSDTP